jgi:hypothetical protein
LLACDGEFSVQASNIGTDEGCIRFLRPNRNDNVGRVLVKKRFEKSFNEFIPLPIAAVSAREWLALRMSRSHPQTALLQEWLTQHRPINTNLRRSAQRAGMASSKNKHSP